jgi:altronate hydrolase
MTRVLHLDPRDNVLIALADLEAGEQAGCRLVSDVPVKHKFAIRDLAPGDAIVMYGVMVGRACLPVRQGELLSTANVSHDAACYGASAAPFRWTPPDVSKWQQKTFCGYRRASGRVGTRNYWIVLPLVFCENRNLAVLQDAFEEELGFRAPSVHRRRLAGLVKLYREGRAGQIPGHLFAEPVDAGQPQRVFPNIDGIKFLLHEMGCGGTREDSNNLCGLLAGYICHPNVAGATVLSLGCQHAQVEILRSELERRDSSFSKPLLIYEQQQFRSESEMVERAIRQTFLGLIEANEAVREDAPLSSLRVALKCGGSDGFSGISANPALGHLADLVVGCGGSAILSEFPELCGVEQNLIDRSARPEIGARFIELIRGYAARAKAVGSGFEMNPSPGNIREGLITDAMKSAGAARKGGTSPVTAVLDYPEWLTEPGLNLLCTPGNDVECVTAQVAAGANLVLFTTGLGTPTGNPIAPVVKVSSNSSLAQRMADIIDFDAGPIVTGHSTIEESGDALLNYTLQVASGGVRTKSELSRQDNFIPWKRGVSL